MKKMLLLTILSILSLISTFGRGRKEYLVQGPKGGLSVRVELPDGFDPGKDTCPGVILMHGVIATKERAPLRRIARSLRKEGIATIRFDFNGQGRSEGKCEEMTLPLEIEDALAVWRYTRSLPFAGPVVLLGHSMGGVVASMAAGRLAAAGTPPAGLVLLAPGSVVRDYAREGRFLGVTCDPVNPPERVSIYGYKLGREFIKTAQQLPVYEESALYQGPVCILHGTRDLIVPVRCSEEYDRLYADSRLHRIEGESHWFLHHPKQADRAILDFVREVTR